MKEKPDVLQGTLALMALKTLDVLGPKHGYGNPIGRKQLQAETRNGEQSAAIIARFLHVKAEDLV